jgi:transposase
MLGGTRQVCVWAYREAVDMRKSFDGLFALVRDQLHRDVLSGDMFLFMGRNRRRAKVLLWDGTGLCVYAKRLEKGRFTPLWSLPDHEALQMTVTELQLFLEGTELVGRWPLSPTPYDSSRPLMACL